MRRREFITLLGGAGGRVGARIAHEMKDLDAKQTMLQGAIRAEAQASLPQSN
jgi:hypothetical protein